MTVEQFEGELSGLSTNLVVGPGVEGSLDYKTYEFDLLVTATSDTSKMYLPRQPRVSYGATYAAWGASGSDKLYKNLDSSGNQVEMDLNISDNKSHEYNINVSAVGNGRPTSKTLGGVEVPIYPSVRLSGTVSNVIIGTADIAPALNLLNFLSVLAL